ncbi:MAG: iron-containing alcohol dehydrogenase, partial [Christensenellaceae bacterium]
MQEIYRSDEKFEELKRILPKGAKCLVVGGSAYKRSTLRQTVEEWLTPVLFDGYSPNPKAEEIKEGVRLFQREKCACILAVGGGSAIDTAKAIKYYSGDPDTDFLSAKPDKEAQTLPLVAIPTTAGTGAESTRYSIFYRDGKKTSLDHPCCLPDEA